MKRLAALAVLAGSCLPATAEVSEDLRFCGARKSAPERLACFEAVTRGTSAARPVARAAPLDARAAVPTKALPLDPLPARNPFDGYYAAIGGGYGTGGGREAAIYSGTIALYAYPTSMNSSGGGLGDFVLGRNIALNWGLVGIELDARFGGPSGVGSGSEYIYPAGYVPLSYRLTNDVAIHIAGRAGLVFDDTLIYAKAGIGATRVRETFTFDQRQLTNTIYDSNTGQYVATTNAGLPLVSTATISWLPSVIFGIGIEKNWDRFFARLSADVEVANHAGAQTSLAGNLAKSSADQLLWTARGTALIGVRF